MSQCRHENRCQARFLTSRSRVRRLSWLFLIGAQVCAAQVETGKIVGTVKDASGAVVAGARITVAEAQTNVVKTTVTNNSGDYVVTELKSGVYAVTVEHSGFKKAIENEFRLDVNQVVRVDFTMALGSIAETVTVAAAEPLVETDTSSTGQVIEQNRVEELPLNGRNFMTLAYLSPGVNAGPTGTVQSGNIPENERDNGSIQVNGLTATNNNYLLNGFDNNEQQIGFELIEPPIDAIDEFKVETSTMTADVGKGGAVVNIAIRSGTNQFHGGVFEFLRNSWMDAKNYFDPANLAIPPYKRNEFGATFGGPIVRDKTFFFVDYQGRRVRQSSTDLSLVPTLPIAANFSGTVTDSRTGQTLTPAQLDPANANTPSGLPLCANATDTSSCLDPAAVNVLALFPAPNLLNSPTGFNYISNPVNRNNQDAFDVKLDQTFVHDSMFALVSFGNVDAHVPDPFPGEAGGGQFTGNINNKSLLAGISDVHTFSPTRINELKLGYTRYLVDAVPFFTGQAIATQLGIPGIYENSEIGGLPGLYIPPLGFSGTSLQNSLGNGDWFPEHLHENNYQLLDAFTLVEGKHSFKMGGDLRRRMHGFFQTQNTHGDFYFTGQYTGNALADFLLGYPFGSAETGQTGLFGMRWWEFGSYFMDDWRVSPKLTLNLGVRYDIYTPEVEEYNRLANFDFSTGEFVQPGVTPDTSRSGDVVTNYHNFSPRIGFAYTPWNSKTAVHGGYGIFYDLQADQNDTELAFNSTGLYGTQLITPSATATNPPQRLFTGFATPANPSGTLPFPIVSNPGGRASAAPFHNPTTYIEEWNLNLERELMKDAVLQIEYAGTRGVHLALLRNENQATQNLDANFEDCPPISPPNFTCVPGVPSNYGRPYFNTVPNVAQIRTEGHDMSSTTNALEVRFEKRFSRSWSMLSSYTYQHTIGQTEENEWAEPQDTYNLRAERGDIAPDYRHQFTSAWSYQLPFGPKQSFFNGNGPVRWIAGGWQVNGIISLYSGQSFTPYLSYDPTNTGSGGPRPQLVGDPNNFSNVTGFGGAPIDPSNPASAPFLPCLGVTHKTPFCLYNPGAFAIPPLATVNGMQQTVATEFGNAGRGILRGPAVYDTDLSVFKNFKLSETGTLQLRAEVFNLFNTPQFAPPVNPSVDASPPSVSSTANTSRQIQLVARFTF
jgi:Carboxypeptidase regulatory-like domain/TonB dependent receptor